MADISTFELLVKRIAPIVGDPFNPINALFRRVVQGYFLTISNPNNTPVLLRFRVRIPVYDPTSEDSLADRELLSNNHIYNYEITEGAEAFSGPLSCRNTVMNGNQRTLISRNHLLPRGQTASFKLLPNLGPDSTIDLMEPRFEVRGYIEVVQLRQLLGEIQPDGSVIFSLLGVNPVNLYFTPEIRGTFLDNAYPDFAGISGELDFDQLAYAIPTVPGGARIQLEEATESLFVICGPFPLPDLDLAAITGRLDYSGRFILDNKALQYFDGELKKAQKEDPINWNFSLPEIRDQIEQEINQMTVFRKKGDK